MSKTIRKTSILIIIILTLLALSIGIGGFMYYLKVKENIKSQIIHELEAVADLKAEQLYRWRTERIADATVLRNDHSFSESVQDFLDNSKNEPIKQEIIYKLSTIADNYRYKDIWLTDTRGNMILSASGSIQSMERSHARYIRRIAEDQEIRFYDFHRDSPQSDDIHLDLCIPILSYANGIATSIAVALIRIDPSTFLYPYIQTWPTPSETAETLIFREDENQVVFLNNPRYNDTLALDIRYPVQNSDLPAAMAVRGRTGTVEGLDYRNEPVVAAIRQVPESPWYLISKIDTHEITRPIRAQSRPVAILIGSFLLICLIGILLVNRWQRSHFYKTQYLSELERQALNRHYEYLTKYANDIILLYDDQFKIIEANEKALTQYGYDYNEMKNMSADDLRAPAGKDRIGDIRSKVENVVGKVYETVHQKKDGSTFPVEISARLIRIENTQYFQAIIRDITERKIHQELLEYERDLMKSVMETSPVGILIVDSKGIISYANNKAEEVFRLSRSMITGRTYNDPAWQILETNGKPYSELPYTIIKTTGKQLHNTEQIIQHPDGEKIIISINGAPLFNHENELSQVVFTVEDITVKVEKDRQLEQLTSNLEEKVEERTAELNVTNRELESFAYTVSHDLRAPLRHMSGYINFFMEDYEDKLDKQAIQYLEKVTESSNTMGQLIDALLQFSRLGRSEMNKEKIDSNELVLSAIEALGAETKNRHIEWHIEDLPPVIADKNLLKQVYVNLISNAIKFSLNNDPSEIRIGCRHQDNGDTFFVKDTGVGFDMKYADKLFKVFQRLHRQDEFEGTGIGLANVRRIIERHGGKVWAEGETGKGATFYFSLQQNPEL